MLNNVSLLCRRVTYYKGHLALDTLTKTELRDMEGDPLTSLNRIQQHGYYAQGHDHVGMIMLPDDESHHTHLCAKPATMKATLILKRSTMVVSSIMYMCAWEPHKSRQQG